MSTNLSRPVINTNFAGEEYVLIADMTTIKVYKEMTGRSYLQSLVDLGQQDDETTLNFIGAVMRRKETPDLPIGKEVFDMDIFSLLTAFNSSIPKLCMATMPQENGVAPKKAVNGKK